MPRSHRGDDVLGRVRTGPHVGVGHARQRHVRERLAPPVAGGLHAHEARVQPVLHVAAQHAVLDERGALRGRALVVDVERAAAARQRAVIDHRALRGRHLLADAVGERRGALAVEVTLEAVADRLVQQDSGPAGAEHHGHGARRRRPRVEVHQRLAHRLARERERALVARPARRARSVRRRRHSPARAGHSARPAPRR